MMHVRRSPNASDTEVRTRIRIMDQDKSGLTKPHLEPAAETLDLPFSASTPASPSDTMPSDETSEHSDAMRHDAYQRFLNAFSDPSTHLARLERLEIRVAEALGMYRDPRPANGKSLLDLYNTVEGCAGAMKKVLDAFSLLEEEEGFCQDKFNILVDDPKREAVALVKTFHRTALASLHDALTDLVTSDRHLRSRSDDSVASEPAVSWSSAPRMVQQTKWIEHFLSPLNVCYDNKATFSPEQRLCQAFSTLFSVLRLGLISYAGSHACDFDYSVFEAEISSQPIKVSESIFLHRKSLACLRGYVGRPIWLFGRRNLTESVSGYRVSIDLDTLTDLWGPAWGIPIESRPNHFQEIFTECGAITRVPASQMPGLHDGEIACHWAEASGLAIRNWMDRSSSENLPRDETLLIDTSCNMLIGMNGFPIYHPSMHALANPTSSLTGAPRPYTTLVHNTGCSSSAEILNHRLSSRLLFPGTSRDRFVVGSYQGQISFSKVVGIGASQTRKRVPGIPLKSQIIAFCNGLPQRQSLQSYLQMKIGLEISACTGNARRVTLGEAIQLANRRTLLERTLESHGTDRIDECTHNVEAISDCVANCWPEGESIRSITHKSAREQAIRQTLVRAITMIEHTGVREGGELHAWYPFLEVPCVLSTAPSFHHVFRERHGWIPMLRDTHLTATFAVVSNRCLEAPRNGLIPNPRYGACLGERDAAHTVCSVLETALTNVTSTTNTRDFPSTGATAERDIPGEGRLCFGASPHEMSGIFDRVQGSRFILGFHSRPTSRLNGACWRIRDNAAVLTECVSKLAAPRRSLVLVVTQ